MTKKLKYKPAVYTKWITQAGNFMTEYMVNVEFSLLLKADKILLLVEAYLLL